MKTKFIIVRHGLTDANSKGLFLSSTDVELSLNGRRQAKSLENNNSLKNIDIIISSPYKRTLSTAIPISNIAHKPIYLSDNLKELNFGDWEGKTHNEISKKFPNEYSTWQTKSHAHKMPNGESLNTLKTRLLDEVNRLEHENPGKTICLVTHGICAKVLMCHFYDKSLTEINTLPWLDNTAVNVVERDVKSTKYNVLSLNDTSHLTDDLKIDPYSNTETLVNNAKFISKKRENNHNIEKYSLLHLNIPNYKEFNSANSGNISINKSKRFNSVLL